MNLQFCAEDTYQATSRFHSFPTSPKMGNGLLVNKKDAGLSNFYFPNSSSGKLSLILFFPISITVVNMYIYSSSAL